MGLEETLKEVPEKLKRTFDYIRRAYSPKKIIAPAILASSLSFATLSCDSGTTEPEHNPPERNPPTQPTNHDPDFYFNNCDFSLNEHDYFYCEMVGNDSDGDMVNYRFQNAPSWLSISNNYVYGFMPEVHQDENFDFSVEIRDGKGGSNVKSETLKVSNLSDTYVITQDTTNQVSSADSNSVTFSEQVNFEVGDQIVADTNGIFPEGTLREVTSVSSDGKTIQTGQGNLGEAVGTGDLSYTHVLRNPEISSFSSLEGIAMMDIAKSETFREFGVKIQNLVLYDLDGNPATTYDQIIANGNIEFDFSMDMDVRIRERELQDFELRSNVEIDSEINIGSNAYGFSQLNDITIAEYRFSPIVVPVGAIPLVMIPKLSVGIGINPTQLNALSVNVSQTTSLETLLEYSGNWNASAEFNNSFEFSNPVFEGEWDLGVFAGPRMNLDLYGVAGPFVGVGGGLIFEGSPTDWALYAGLNASAGVSVGLLKNVSAYAKQVIEERWLLAQSDTTTKLEEKIFHTETFLSNGIIQDEEIFSRNPDGTGLENMTGTPDIREIFPYPFPNGTRIAYVQDGDVWTMEVDGGNRINLTNTPNVRERRPSVSPDGTRIAYVQEGDIWITNVNGENNYELFQDSSIISVNSSWSPNGNIIVFDAYLENKTIFDRDIYKINVDTREISKLTNNEGSEEPSWSPKEDLIAFIDNETRDIRLMGPNGEDRGNVTGDGSNTYEMNPSWSPYGSKITYRQIIPDASGDFIIWVIDVDGTNKTRITNRGVFGAPKWGMKYKN